VPAGATHHAEHTVNGTLSEASMAKLRLYREMHQFKNAGTASLEANPAGDTRTCLNRDKFNLEPKSGIGLRKCQLGAIWALKSFFVANSPEVAALISMPTGSGKSAIMMAACFELGLSKILIIEPSKVLRNQICEQFRKLEILKSIGCLPFDFPEIKVFEVKQIQSSDDWSDIAKKRCNCCTSK